MCKVILLSFGVFPFPCIFLKSTKILAFGESVDTRRSTAVSHATESYYDGFELDTREKMIFSHHLRQLPKHKMHQCKCYPLSQMRPLTFTDPETSKLHVPQELKGQTPYLCPPIEGKYGDLYEEWRNKSDKLIAQDASVVLAKFYGLPIHKSQINRLKLYSGSMIIWWMAWWDA